MAANRVEDANLISDELAEHILGVATDVEAEAPVAARSIVQLLADARADASDDELAGESAAVAQFLENIHARPAQGLRGPLSGWQRRATAIAAAAAVMFGGFGVAAAANGSLPDPMQRLAHDNLVHLGIDVPSPRAVPSTTDPNHGKTVSSVAKSTDAIGVEKGMEVCAAASNDRCRTGQTSTSAKGHSNSAPESTDGDHEHGQGNSTPAMSATPAAPGGPGTSATPATPATPAVPSGSADPTTPEKPVAPAKPVTPAHPGK